MNPRQAHSTFSVAKDALLFGRRRDLAAKRRKEAQKQIPIVYIYWIIDSTILVLQQNR